MGPNRWCQHQTSRHAGCRVVASAHKVLDLSSALLTAKFEWKRGNTSLLMFLTVARIGKTKPAVAARVPADQQLYKNLTQPSMALQLSGLTVSPQCGLSCVALDYWSWRTRGRISDKGTSWCSDCARKKTSLPCGGVALKNVKGVAGQLFERPDSLLTRLSRFDRFGEIQRKL